MPYYLVRRTSPLARLARLGGDPIGAETLAHEALTGPSAISAKSRIVDCLEVLAGVEADLGSRQDAARLFGAAQRSARRHRLRRCISERDADIDDLRADARRRRASKPPSKKAQPYPSTMRSPTPDGVVANGNARRPVGPASPQPRSESPNWSKTDCPTPTSAADCCARHAPCKPI